MDITTILLTIIVIIFVKYFYSKYNYFGNYGIPHIKPIPIFGNIAPAIFNLASFAEYTKKFYHLDNKAKYVGFFNFNSPTIIIRDLDLIKDVCIQKFDNFVNHQEYADPKLDPLFGNTLFAIRDDRWREMRNILSPSFTSSKMRTMFELMSKCSEAFTTYWIENNSNVNLNVNSKEVFCKYTTDVIATCAYGISIDSLRNPTNEFYTYGMKSAKFDRTLLLKFFIRHNFAEMTKFFNIKLFMNDTENFFYQIIAETVKQRRENGITRPDMIQLMMESHGVNKYGKFIELSVEEMASQAFVFFIGGFDSTSSIMCYLSYHLAIDADIQIKLRAEVDELYEKCNGNLTHDAVRNMKYLDALLYETMRIYPTDPTIERLCNKDFELPPALPGAKPYSLKVGDSVWCPAYCIHHDPDYFPDPEKFLPERFLDENSKSIINSPIYFPFGIGPRMCIANRFALLQMKVLFVNLIHKCTLKLGKNMKLPLTLERGLSTSVEGGFWLDIVPRSE